MSSIPVIESELKRMGIVYRLWCGTYHYTGSTHLTLAQRIYEHKRASKKETQRKVYKKIAENGGWDVVKWCVLEENIPTEELVIKEQSYINKADPMCLNTWSAYRPLVPARVPKNSPEKLEYDKAYYQKNKEAIRKRQDAYYKKISEDPVAKERRQESVRKAMKRYTEKKKAQALATATA